MALSGALRILASLGVALPVIAGCAGVGYREQSTLSHTRYATIENFGDEEITAEQVDGLLEEVAEILDVRLRPATPKVRIMVRSLGDIALLSRRTGSAAGHGTECGALYFAGANLVVIPYYSRTILGHELAHYRDRSLPEVDASPALGADRAEGRGRASAVGARGSPAVRASMWPRGRSSLPSLAPAN